jgi:hypothetical protein
VHVAAGSLEIAKTKARKKQQNAKTGFIVPPAEIFSRNTLPRRGFEKIAVSSGITKTVSDGACASSIRGIGGV